MSGVYGIGNGYSSLSLVDLLSNGQKEENSILDTSTTAAKARMLQASSTSTNKRAGNAYGISASSGVGQAALNRALSEMGNSGSRVTFKDIANYQKELETRFSASLRMDLYEQGVDMNTEFSLNMSSEGEIEVLCNDPVAKEKIINYLKDNPEVCEDFGYIQALANLDRARKGPAGASMLMDSIVQSKKAIQLEAVNTFFDEALSSGMKYSSLMASFSPLASIDDASSDAAKFYAGVGYLV